MISTSQILHREAGEVARRAGGGVWAVLPVAGLLLSACAGVATRDGGVATLDALSDAQAACEAKGQTLKLKPEGDAHWIDAYACERK